MQSRAGAAGLLARLAPEAHKGAGQDDANSGNQHADESREREPRPLAEVLMTQAQVVSVKGT